MSLYVIACQYYIVYVSNWDDPEATDIGISQPTKSEINDVIFPMGYETMGNCSLGM